MAEMPKIPEGEKMFAFMVWVALIGAAIILAIDYSTKRQLLALALEVREGLNGQVGQAGSTGAIDPASNLPIPHVGHMANSHDASVETGDAVEHTPFPVRTVERARDERGRFSAQNSNGIGRDGNSTIPGTNHPVEP
jgi:hypothetical protein